MIARAAGNPLAGIPLPGLSIPRPRGKSVRPIPAAASRPLLVEVRFAGAPIVGYDVSRRVALRDALRDAPQVGLIDRRVASRLHSVRWRGLALASIFGLALGGNFGLLGRHYLNQLDVAVPLPGVTSVQPMPIAAATSVEPVSAASPTPTPARLLLQVPYTTQAPLANWAQHQESCEEATLSMLDGYWQRDPSVVIDPHAADTTIAALVSWQVQHWGSEDDLTDARLGELAKQYYGYGYRIVPNDPQVIRLQIAAGRPLIAGVRTHGLGNSNYPGYNNHFEQQGWSVPHFVLVIGYDSDGVWLNDPGITKGRGYHITWAQLTHAIDDLNQNYPALSQGQVLLVVGPEVNPTPVKSGSMSA